MSRNRNTDICATGNTELKNVSNERDFKTLLLFTFFHLYGQVNRALVYTSIFIRVGFVVM
jgi:hypothetical protein